MGALNVPVTWSDPPASQRLTKDGFAAKVRSKVPAISIEVTSVITMDPLVAWSLTTLLQCASRAHARQRRPSGEDGGRGRDCCGTTLRGAGGTLT